MIGICDLKNWLETLNHYSNLLLVVITGIYVVLTWKSLAALRNSHLRESQSRHLAEIKAHVAEPILSWADEILATFSGVGTRYLTLVQLVQDGDAVPRGMEIRPRRIPLSNLSESLLDDALKVHFPREIEQYTSFRHILESLFDDLHQFSIECCDEIRPLTNIRKLDSVNRLGQFESIEELVHASLPSLLRGAQPQYYLQPAAIADKGVFNVFMRDYAQASIAGDVQRNLEHWLPAAIRLIEEKWKAKKFTSRITDVRESATSVRNSIQSILFMQEIRGKCKYVGG